MKKIIASFSAVVIGLGSLAGCANMSETQRTTGTGAGIGAVAGAVIGAATAGGHKGKSAATGAAIGAAVGAGGGYLWSKHMEKQRADMEQATRGTGVNVTQTADNRLKMEIPSDVSFDTGRYDIKPNMRPILDRFANTLNENPVTTVTITGHTDRAAATRNYLVARGVASNRIAINGRGSHEPIADNNTISGRAMNRRVEIFVAEAAR